MFWSSLISLDSQAGWLLFISAKENIFQCTRRYCCFATVGRHLCSAASQVTTFPNYVRGYLGKQHEPLQIVTRSETISNCSGWIGNPADAQIQQLVTLFLSCFIMISLSVGLVMVAFCEIQNLGFSSILCHLFLTSVVFFFVFFCLYISIKSLGVKGYSFYFLTTVNDMVSQKKWGENFSFPVLFVFIADYEKTSKWSDSWVEKGEKQCPIHLHTQVLQTFFCFSTNGFGHIRI